MLFYILFLWFLWLLQLLQADTLQNSQNFFFFWYSVYFLKYHNCVVYCFAIFYVILFKIGAQIALTWLTIPCISQTLTTQTYFIVCVRCTHYLGRLCLQFTTSFKQNLYVSRPNAAGWRFSSSTLTLQMICWHYKTVYAKYSILILNYINCRGNKLSGYILNVEF